MNSNLCKAHSYSHIGHHVTDIIISFDPRDAADNGLTLEKAQALGLQFCKENFPGHPAIVCAHPDGHNGAGNIHVHIVIGSVRNLELETRDEVLVWICKHQLGRRNLTPEQKKFLMGKQYDAEKQADGFHRNQHTRPVPSAGAQNEHQQTAEKTCERIARENHISASAVRRAALFAAGVDLAEELCPGIRQRVLSGDLKAPDALFERLAKAKPEEYSVLLEQIKNPQSRAKPAAKQKLFQAKKSASSDPPLSPYQGESKPDLKETHSVYSQLADASTTMQERWDTIFKQTPTLLIDSEQRKVIQAIVENHLAYLAALGFDLSGMTESKGEQFA